MTSVPSTNASTGTSWRFFRFGLLVTGQGEEKFLPYFFGSLADGGTCHFRVLRRIDQLAPITSTKRIEIVGSKKGVFGREQEIGVEARKFINEGADRFVLVIDDLEAAHDPNMEAKFSRYKKPLDALLGDQKWRAAVHFLRNMIEAYYFADAAAVNSVLGMKLQPPLQDHVGDVEGIKHPKGDLKRWNVGFDEVEHGEKIVKLLNLEHVLSQLECCASLRSLFGWCAKAMGQLPTSRFCLDTGSYLVLTGRQLASLPDGCSGIAEEASGQVK